MDKNPHHSKNRTVGNDHQGTAYSYMGMALALICIGAATWLTETQSMPGNIDWQFKMLGVETGLATNVPGSLWAVLGVIIVCATGPKR